LPRLKHGGLGVQQKADGCIQGSHFDAEVEKGHLELWNVYSSVHL